MGSVSIATIGCRCGSCTLPVVTVHAIAAVSVTFAPTTSTTPTASGTVAGVSLTAAWPPGPPTVVLVSADSQCSPTSVSQPSWSRHPASRVARQRRLHRCRSAVSLRTCGHPRSHALML